MNEGLDLHTVFFCVAAIILYALGAIAEGKGDFKDFF
jgi:hypothetical protein